MEAFPLNESGSPKRTVICGDAVLWLQDSPPLLGCSVVTSLPDISEFPNFSIKDWSEWFIDAAKLIFSRTPEDGVSIFYQSDIKFEGTWIDKSFLCQKAAESSSDRLLWHKIICRIAPGNTTFGRPAYSHILCFSKGVRLSSSASTPDVIPDLGEQLWPRGMGQNACKMIAKFVLQETESKTIVNPFCGHGTMLAAANQEGLAAIGIEKSPKRARISEGFGD